LSRIVNPDSAGKERTRLSKAIVVAVRELAGQQEPDGLARDLCAFIAMALQIIAGTIETSVSAWEKRGYWVKADKFRLDWTWAGVYGEKMKQAVLADDWTEVAIMAPKIASKLHKITVSTNHRLGEPWVGAWEKLNRGKKQ